MGSVTDGCRAALAHADSGRNPEQLSFPSFSGWIKLAVRVVNNQFNEGRVSAAAPTA